MKRLDLSLSDPAANLALDEALLQQAEDAPEGDGELLRLWAFAQPAVIIGRGSRLSGETDQGYCQRHGIPILRRCSGGAAVVAGPGCLMYSVVLNLDARPQLRQVDHAHDHVMSRLRAAIAEQQPAVRWQGTCDLTLGGRKFSGNSLRVARRHLLYHGTILHAADLDQIHRCLATPPRQPEYRQGRSHADFLTNLNIDTGRLRASLAAAFGAGGQWPQEISGELETRTRSLVAQRYGNPAWHHRH